MSLAPAVMMQRGPEQPFLDGHRARPATRRPAALLGKERAPPTGMKNWRCGVALAVCNPSAMSPRVTCSPAAVRVAPHPAHNVQTSNPSSFCCHRLFVFKKILSRLSYFLRFACFVFELVFPCCWFLGLPHHYPQVFFPFKSYLERGTSFCLASAARPRWVLAWTLVGTAHPAPPARTALR